MRQYRGNQILLVAMRPRDGVNLNLTAKFETTCTACFAHTESQAQHWLSNSAAFSMSQDEPEKLRR